MTNRNINSLRSRPDNQTDHYWLLQFIYYKTFTKYRVSQKCYIIVHLYVNSTHALFFRRTFFHLYININYINYIRIRGGTLNDKM